MSQKTDAFISLELDGLIDGLCVLYNNYACFLSITCTSLIKGPITSQMM